jgi:hypothetical protein
MAIWVPLNRAAKFPEVNRVYKRAGWGQGAQGLQTAGQSQTTGNPTSAPRGFLETVRAAVSASFANGASLPAWIKKSPGGGPASWQDAQVDVTAIPGVRPLNTNGKSKQFIA